ncbi:hypothetical protein MMP74_14790 [Acinetobacter sp. NIPH 1869]|uniref:phage tail assembly chaperone n=1 Tax=Acinetobacter higginsii TaxID=70347 RepID=UPI001F4AD784|nr:hypothetical protein [Acinetobacter higginsii]MCH7305628.1 hypothetical protein [Acinetobacter higginsii]
MSNLKQKMIGNKSIVLKPVPARDARKMQMHLAALLSGPLTKVLPQENEQPQAGLSHMAKGVVMGVGAFSALFSELDDGEADRLINDASRFIFIDGEALDENKHFTADTLLDLYEAIWFFYSETFGGFFGEIRSRFPKVEQAMTTLSQLNLQTSTGSSGALV